MTDIVERLRALADATGYLQPEIAEAADTIYCQWEEIGRLKEAFSAVLSDMPIIDCDRLHHAKEDRHRAGLCPVETRLETAIARARAALSDTTRGK
jgi:hypothetical protein